MKNLPCYLESSIIMPCYQTHTQPHFINNGGNNQYVWIQIQRTTGLNRKNVRLQGSTGEDGGFLKFRNGPEVEILKQNHFGWSGGGIDRRWSLRIHIQLWYGLLCFLSEATSGMMCLILTNIQYHVWVSLTCLNIKSWCAFTNPDIHAQRNFKHIPIDVRVYTETWEKRNYKKQEHIKMDSMNLKGSIVAWLISIIINIIKVGKVKQTIKGSIVSIKKGSHYSFTWRQSRKQSKFSWLLSTFLTAQL